MYILFINKNIKSGIVYKKNFNKNIESGITSMIKRTKEFTTERCPCYFETVKVEKTLSVYDN